MHKVDIICETGNIFFICENITRGSRQASFEIAVKKIIRCSLVLTWILYTENVCFNQ